MNEPIKSQYQFVLNNLFQMQQAYAYAARKGTLIEAENSIVKLEQQRDALVAILKRLWDSANDEEEYSIMQEAMKLIAEIEGT